MTGGPWTGSKVGVHVLSSPPWNHIFRKKTKLTFFFNFVLERWKYCHNQLSHSSSQCIRQDYCLHMQMSTWQQYSHCFLTLKTIVHSQSSVCILHCLVVSDHLAKRLLINTLAPYAVYSNLCYLPKGEESKFFFPLVISMHLRTLSGWRRIIMILLESVTIPIFIIK